MGKPRKFALETPTARAKLAPRKASYFVRVAPHIALGYRRNQSGFGTRSVRFADGSASGWLKAFGTADDKEPANNNGVFSYDQALIQARKLARGEADAETEAAAAGFAPVNLDGALTAYTADLKARGGSKYNASGLRKHLSSALLARPVALLNAKELRAWRDGLLAKSLQPSSVVRYCKSLRAALNLAASHDKRIQNCTLNTPRVQRLMSRSEMPDPEQKYFVDIGNLPPHFPTHLHGAAFWEALGRTIATFGFLEEILGKAIFAFTATTRYPEKEVEAAYEKWLPTLERALIDQLANLIDAYGKAVRNNSEVSCCRFDGHLVKLIPPCVRTQQG